MTSYGRSGWTTRSPWWKRSSPGSASRCASWASTRIRGEEIVVMSGRYGPYVTDGSTNATLPKGTEPEEVDLETAIGLIAEKAAKGSKKKGRRGTKR